MTRHRARQRARNRKVERFAREAAQFEAHYPGLIGFLRTARPWSDFAATMLRAHRRHGALTVEQALKACQFRENV